jgi:hypothetical protein
LTAPDSGSREKPRGIAGLFFSAGYNPRPRHALAAGESNGEIPELPVDILMPSKRE